MVLAGGGGSGQEAVSAPTSGAPGLQIYCPDYGLFTL